MLTTTRSLRSGSPGLTGRAGTTTGTNWEGIDYPAGDVRWTERRNLECFLDLLARQDLEVATLVSGTFPMADAGSVYAELS